ncbi:DNA internalization-related competence protein ComEC/Rec2 [Ahniella affigens]|uniref:DNA internalization-related competence protein ComEC/Rec2 n=1 Tax=Ahniella affigens TaxID=2021234 RepID=A0A2P1PMQ7_9GAMM|nr:DNA internalization-related competence protein ComEC/Rec2 [Ahniella affigens]AVP96125.1 DNA internalization-related competence protein ComEC/Rec2 [Ahniella affigens]
MNSAATDRQPVHRPDGDSIWFSSPARRQLYALAWLLGLLCAHLLPTLPGQDGLLVLTLLSLTLLWPPQARWLGWSGLGAVYAIWAASHALADRLPVAATGADLDVFGTVVGLPERQPEQQRFELHVVSWHSADPAFRWTNAQPTLRVSWYGHEPTIRSGDSFRGTVRVRPPIALVNPGSFDFERHALAQGLDAMAYVRSGQIETGAPSGLFIDRFRQNWSTWIQTSSQHPELGPLLAGLAVGDQAAISDASWQRLRVTGTTHLMAISGLHIGLVAAFAAWLTQGLYVLWPGLARRWTRPDLAGLAGLAAALIYACLAGWSLPVQRTILMIALVIVCLWTRRYLSSFQMLLTAAVLAVLFDPLAPLSAGFWLSFLGVFSLMLALPGWRVEKPWQAMWRAQWVATIFLLPVGIAWFQQASVVGPLANLLAIPWITFGVVPLLLLAMLCPIEAVSAWLIKLATLSLSGLWHVLGWCEQWSFASIDLPETTLPLLLLALLGAVILLLPRPFAGRWFGLCCLLPLFVPAINPVALGHVRISVLDVGQGLAVLVQTRAHNLLYDTGARTRGGFDLGEVVVVPALRSLGVRQLDRLIISHLDNDHAGGRQAVRRAYPAALEQVGIETDPSARCERGEHWEWDGVQFQFLHPPRHFPDLGNESSCVLQITAGTKRALLTGDIGADVEARLLHEPILGPLSLLLVPHHGSRFASSLPFLDATEPRFAAVSSGFANRFGHPSHAVLERLQTVGATPLNTAYSGMLQFELGPEPGTSPPTQQRAVSRRYWRLAPDALAGWDRR